VGGVQETRGEGGKQKKKREKGLLTREFETVRKKGRNTHPSCLTPESRSIKTLEGGVRSPPNVEEEGNMKVDKLTS